MSFDTLGLSQELLRALAEEKYSTPTPIQRKAIPVILNKQDIMASAQTGTGKTAGFALPLLQRLMSMPKGEGEKGRQIKALILTPTRELAAQVGESIQKYGKYLPLKTAIVFGGVGIGGQISALRRGVDILVATPGRLLDHVEQRTVNLSNVNILVLDEADRMLDMGFIKDIRKVLSLLPKARQSLLFSATFSEDIKNLANGMLNSPERIEVARQITADGVKQIIHPVDSKRKSALLSFLISSKQWKQVLVFTRTKHGADKLTEKLIRSNIRATAIHGNKSQMARTKALADFKNGYVSVLVATDIAARGLDIDQLPHVVNFELPHVPEDYVHRIGRTGRAGNDGAAISLVCVDEHKLLRDIERLVKHDIPKEIIEGYEPDPSIKAEEIQRGKFSGRQDRQRMGGNAKTPDRYWNSIKTKSSEGDSYSSRRGTGSFHGKSDLTMRARANEGKGSFYGSFRNSSSRLKGRA